MTTRKLRLVAGDSPQILLALADRDSGQPTNLSDGGTSVLFKVRQQGVATLKGQVTCTKLTGLENEDGVVITTAAPYDVPGSGGRCMAACPPTLFDVAGEYEAEIEITFADRVSTVYDVRRITVRPQF